MGRWPRPGCPSWAGAMCPPAPIASWRAGTPSSRSPPETCPPSCRGLPCRASASRISRPDRRFRCAARPR
eukprot:11168459-Lingulodinium_polyedra.AAC.1